LEYWEKIWQAPQKSHMTWTGVEPGPSQWETGDWRLELWYGQYQCCLTQTIFLRSLIKWWRGICMFRLLQAISVSCNSGPDWRCGDYITQIWRNGTRSARPVFLYKYYITYFVLHNYSIFAFMIFEKQSARRLRLWRLYVSYMQRRPSSDQLTHSPTHPKGYVRLEVPTMKRFVGIWWRVDWLTDVSREFIAVWSWRWRQYVPPKCGKLLPMESHSERQ
jgi:hypothetical protein